MSSHRWFHVAVLAVLALAVAPASFASTPVGKFERSFNVNGPVDLEIYTHSGDVSVRAGETGTVTVVGKIFLSNQWERWFSNSESNPRVKEIENNPPVHQNANNVRVDYLSEHGIYVDYEITVPVDTQVRTKSGSGDITVEGTKGRLELQTGSGDVKLSRITGDMQFETGSGDVRGTELAGSVSARAGSGDIELEEVGAGDMEVHTGSGTVGLRGLNGGLQVETGSGDVSAEGTPKNAWNIHTGSGNAKLQLQGNAGFDIEATTSSGNINVGQPVVTTVVGRVQESRRSISGKVRGGGPAVAVHTSSGDIDID